MSPSDQRPATLPLDAAIMPPEPVDLSGTVLMGRYRLEQLIARGGMGSVYLAEQLVLHGRFAVKILSPRFAHEREFVARFLQEARASSQIGHPNIVQIIDFGRDGDLVFMVMEYLAGSDLGALLRELREPLAWSRLGRIVLQIASALAAAHKVGLVHRDIKPSNCVCMTLADGSDMVKVVDFGIAKALEGADLVGQQGDSPHTSTGVHMGTLDYMAPEIFRGAPPDPRIDVFSLGVLMYKMLTGRLPFPRVSPENIHSIDRSDPPVPSAHPRSRGCSPEVDAVVRRALAYDPRQRYASMGELAAAVEESLGHTTPEPTTQVRVSAEASLQGPIDEASTPAGSGAVVVSNAPARPRSRYGRPAIVALALIGMVSGALMIANVWKGDTSRMGDVQAEAEVSALDDPSVEASPGLTSTPNADDTNEAAFRRLDDGGGLEADSGTGDAPSPDNTVEGTPSSLPAPESPAPLPPLLSKRTVESHLQRLAGVAKCVQGERGDRVSANYAITIAQDGSVQDVKWLSGLGYPSESCVIGLIRKIKVGASREGGRFTCDVVIETGSRRPDEVKCARQ